LGAIPIPETLHCFRGQFPDESYAGYLAELTKTAGVKVKCDGAWRSLKALGCLKESLDEFIDGRGLWCAGLSLFHGVPTAILEFVEQA
jgi:hypothetical protein